MMDNQQSTEKPDPQKSRRDVIRKIVIGATAILLATGRSAYAQDGTSGNGYGTTTP